MMNRKDSTANVSDLTVSCQVKEFVFSCGLYHQILALAFSWRSSKWMWVIFPDFKYIPIIDTVPVQRTNYFFKQINMVKNFNLSERKKNFFFENGDLSVKFIRHLRMNYFFELWWSICELFSRLSCRSKWQYSQFLAFWN